MFRTASSLIFAICAATASAAPARADEMGTQTNSIVVSYADLDIHSTAGAKTLISRIKVASRRVCGDRPWAEHLREVARYKTCIQDAMSGAVAQAPSMVVQSEYFVQKQQQVAAR